MDDRERLAASLASADAFVHGSAAETYGLVVAEAICSGLPVVVPDVGGAADLAAPEYAETYRPGDSSGCAEAIIRVLARPQTELLSACMSAKAAKIGTMDDHFEKLFELYASLLRRRA